jgi:hypothetical protein
MGQYSRIGTKVGTMLGTLKQRFFLNRSCLPPLPSNIAQWRKRCWENVANPPVSSSESVSVHLEILQLGALNIEISIPICLFVSLRPDSSSVYQTRISFSLQRQVKSMQFALHNSTTSSVQPQSPRFCAKRVQHTTI